MISNLDIEPKCQGHSKNLKISIWGTKNMPPLKKGAGIPLVTGVQLMCQICYELPTYYNRSGSTKVMNDQVNYHYCCKVSGM